VQGCPNVVFPPDDHGDTPAEATPIAKDGTPINGLHEVADDVDVFSFSATEGEAIRYSIQGSGSNNVPVIVLRAPDGVTFAGSVSTADILVASTTGTYFAEVKQDFNGHDGPYTLTVTGPITDDHGNLPTQATALMVEAPAVSGEIDFRNDRDYFSFPAIEGTPYVVDIGANNLRILAFDTDGTTQIAVSASSQLQFTAPRTGTLFIRIEGLIMFGTTGPYQISVAQQL
jgi:hypothetical protein